MVGYSRNSPVFILTQDGSQWRIRGRKVVTCSTICKVQSIIYWTLFFLGKQNLLGRLAVVQISAWLSWFDVAAAPNISPAEAKEAPIAKRGVRCPNSRRSSNSRWNKANISIQHFTVHFISKHWFNIIQHLLPFSTLVKDFYRSLRGGHWCAKVNKKRRCQRFL